MEIKFLRAAKNRFLEIWDHTERTWGEVQADRYIRGLVDAIHETAADRPRWRPLLHEGFPGVYFIRFERHFIFFRNLSMEAIGVISALHDSMDIPMRLREQDTRQIED